MSDLIGQQVGRYQVLELLGEGGMATVYKAHDPRLERDVAIKVIRRDAFPPEDLDMLLKRFEREAKALGKLSHPNIVGVIDYGEHEGSPYLVMVYVGGGTLKDRLGYPLPPMKWRDAVRMLLPIARALEYVHERGIINRDVKPSNILMTEDGQPLLSDFGLAKLFEKDKESTSITGTGMGIGTPDYMAPEQWTGEPTAQSDLYSLGVVLYEMVTGHRPYTADTPAGILLKQATESLPLPKTYIPDLPQNVESVLLKALAKDPADRYPDVRTFAQELDNLLAGRAVDATNTRPEILRDHMTGRAHKAELPTALPMGSAKKGFPALWVALAVLALIVVAGGAFFASGGFGLLAAPSPTATLAATLPPTGTAVPFTETPAPTLAPTETLVPTITPLPDEIRDVKNVPMRFIPGGEFAMGSDTGEADSRPASQVSVAPFYIDKFEVTNEMYDACVFARECRRPQQAGSATRTSYYGSPVFANYPVIYVDWKMAKTYCEWRGARLPTEAEWEFAARGADGRSYPWGEKVDCSFANAAGCVGDTTPVDQYANGQSPFGVYGMAGNVWEWTSSLFKFYPYDAADGREDLTTPGQRMARGGSWHTFGGNGGNVRTDIRLKLDPAYYGAYVGFRCALSQ